jgi:hypothetical protein
VKRQLLALAVSDVAWLALLTVVLLWVVVPPSYWLDFGPTPAPSAVPSTTTSPAPVRPSPRPSRSRQPAPKPLGPADFTVVAATAYCEHTVTASGLRLPFRSSSHPLVAAGNRWPLHTRLFVPELEATFSIEDRIGHGSQLDLYFMPTRESWEPPDVGSGSCRTRALRFGRRQLHVAVIGGPGGWTS